MADLARLRAVCEVDSAGAEAGLARLHGGIGKLSAGLGLMTGALAAVGIAVAGAFELKSAINTTTALGERVYRMGQMFGLASESASKWLYVASSAGVTDDSLNTGFKMLSKNLETTVLNVKTLTKHMTVGASATKVWTANVTHFVDGTSKTSKVLTEHTIRVKGHAVAVKEFMPVANAFTRAMDTLGVKYLDNAGKMRSLDAVTLDLADAFNKLPASFDAAGLAQVIFGKSGIDMLPILKLGKQGILDLENEAQKYGLVITSDNLPKIHDYIVAHRQLDSAMQGMQLTIGTALIPVLTALSQKVTDAFQTIRIWIDKNPAMVTSLQNLGIAGVAFVGRAIDGLAQLIEGPTGGAIAGNPEGLQSKAERAAKGLGGTGPDSLASAITTISGKLTDFVNSKSTADFLKYWQDLAAAIGAVVRVLDRANALAKSSNDQYKGPLTSKGPPTLFGLQGLPNPPTGGGSWIDTKNPWKLPWQKGASGFEGMVHQPTMFLAGEAGSERVSIRPTGGAGGGGLTLNVHGFVGSPDQLFRVFREGIRQLDMGQR